jgi:hypothetical protein
MKHLTILVPDGQNNLSSIVGTYKIFTKANEYWKNSDSYRSDSRELSTTWQMSIFHIPALRYD